MRSAPAVALRHGRRFARGACTRRPRRGIRTRSRARARGRARAAFGGNSSACARNRTCRRASSTSHSCPARRRARARRSRSSTSSDVTATSTKRAQFVGHLALLEPAGDGAAWAWSPAANMRIAPLLTAAWTRRTRGARRAQLALSWSVRGASPRTRRPGSRAGGRSAAHRRTRRRRRPSSLVARALGQPSRHAYEEFDDVA